MISNGFSVMQSIRHTSTRSPYLACDLSLLSLEFIFWSFNWTGYRILVWKLTHPFDTKLKMNRSRYYPGCIHSYVRTLLRTCIGLRTLLRMCVGLTHTLTHACVSSYARMSMLLRTHVNSLTHVCVSSYAQSVCVRLTHVRKAYARA